MKKKKLLNIFYVLSVVTLLATIIPINNGKTLLQTLTNNYEATNAENYNKLKVSSVNLVERKTGAAPFNTTSGESVDDGSVLSNDQGIDVSTKDKYVRTLDTLFYKFEIGIDRNELTTDDSFYTTGGVIRIVIDLPDEKNIKLRKDSWMSNYYYYSDKNQYTISYNIPNSKNPIGGLQELEFTFNVQSNNVVLNDDLKPKFHFYMDGNITDYNISYPSVDYVDPDDIIITGKKDLNLKLSRGIVNYLTTIDNVKGFVFNFGNIVSNNQVNSSVEYRGTVLPSKDIYSYIDFEYQYKAPGSSDYVSITEDTQEGLQTLNGIKYIAGGPLEERNDDFLPGPCYNRIVDIRDGKYSGSWNGYGINFDSGKIQATKTNHSLTLKSTDYYYYGNYTATYGSFILSGVELFVPLLDQNRDDYEYRIILNAKKVEEKNNDEVLTDNTSNSQLVIDLHNITEGDSSIRVQPIKESSSSDLMLLAPNTTNNGSEVVVQSKGGPFLGGTEVLIAWDSSIANYYSNSFYFYYNSYNTSLSQANSTTLYGVYKNNKNGGIIGDDAVNAAVYDDFDWYSSPESAKEHGKIAAINVYAKDVKGLGDYIRDTINLEANKNSNSLSTTYILRAKAKMYYDEDKQNYIQIAYDEPYEKMVIENGQIVQYSNDSNIGDTIMLSPTSKSIRIYTYNTNDNWQTTFNVQEEQIKIKVAASLGVVDANYADITDNVHIRAMIPEGLTYVPNSSSIEPKSVTVESGYSTSTTYIEWELLNWRIGDPLPQLTFLAEISPYMKNNKQVTIAGDLRLDSDLPNGISVSFTGITTYGLTYKPYNYTHVSFINLSGQSIRKKIDKAAIDPNESVIISDKLYNISQTILTNVNTIQEIPKNNDSYGSSYNGTYRLKVNSIDNNMKLYYTKTSIADFNIQLDSNNRYLPKNIDFENDSRWIEINSNEYIPNDATIIGSHYDELTTESDVNYSLVLETSDNSIGDKYCMQTFGASDNLDNSVVSDNKCVIVANRTIRGLAYISSQGSGSYNSNNDEVIKNTTVILLDENRNELKRTTTDDLGKYSFNSLRRGIYYIKYEIDEHFEYLNKYISANIFNNINKDTGLSDQIYSLNNLNNYEVTEVVNIGLKRKKYNLTTHHLLENTTTKLVEDVTDEYSYDAEYVALPSTSVPSKYEVKSTVGSTSGNISEDTEVTFYYGLKNAKVIVKYIDKDTNTSFETDDEYNKKYDDPYSVSPKTFEHYNYDSKEGVESGTVASDEIVVKYFYTKKPATLTVHHYYDGTTTSICDDVIDTNKHHTDPYSTSACTTIPQNYEYKSVVGSTSGTINSDSVVVTYYYQKKNSTISNTVTKTGDSSLTTYGKKVKYKLTINHEVSNYIGNGTLTIVDTIPYHIDASNSILDGGTYNNTAKTITWTIPVNNIDSFNEIEGKYLVSVEKNIELKYSDLDPKDRSMINTVNSTITLDNNTSSKSAEKTTNIAIKGKIKVRYIDENGDELDPNINSEELVGTIFTAEAKEFTGYELKERPTNESVEYKVEDQELVYKYEHIKYNVVIKANTEGGDVEGNEVVFYGEDSTDGKLKIKAAPGFTIKSITINGEKYEFDPKPEITLNKFTNITDNIIIEVEFQELINSPNTDTNSIVKLIAIALIIIMTYFIFKKRKELFN